MYGIKDSANLTMFDKATGKPFLYSDYANVSTNEWSSDRQYATAKGTNAIAWDGNRQSKLTIETEIIDLKMIAMLAGTEVAKGEKSIAKRELVRVGADQKVTLAGTPLKGSIQVMPVSALNLTEHEGVMLEEVVLDEEDGDTLTPTQYTVKGGELTFEKTMAEGTPLAVYFIETVKDVKSIVISADKFPKAFRIVADALIREKETGRDDFVQIEYFNARPQSNFTLTFSATEPTKLSVVCDLFPNKDKAMAEYKIIED